MQGDMKIRLVLTIAIISSIAANAYSQSPIDYLKNNAIEIVDRADTNFNVFNAIKDYPAILIGEMHGTIEPSEFLIGIVKTLSDKGKQIVVGLEIPNDQYGDIIKMQNINELKSTNYFINSVRDGRQSHAWAEMIIRLKKIKNVELIFFDLTKDEFNIPDINRDSLMYLKINEALKNKQKSYLVTLSGNLHNQLKIRKNIKPMGYYLQNDINSFLKDSKILSLSHLYGQGTMMNTMSDGYKLRETKCNAGYFGSSINYGNYLFIFDGREWLKGYTGVIYSKTIRASGPLVGDEAGN
jgi:hypothetical protein